ncbi:MAG TPA: polysaccharide deacetylase family protein [Verrucomicrobiae bacterium]|nr:polysaccharide deacetylase family protein [Verrucomicrobiae bacterium]
MSRYRICALVALALCGLAYAFGKPTLCWLVLPVFLVLVGLGVAFPQFRFFGPFICRGNSSRREVALTFDDGPDGRSTPALLDLLKSENISATFFCIGKRVAAERELTRRLAEEKHLLGNHTYHHSNLTNCFGPRRLREELQLTQAAIAAATGTAPEYFRPPMGLSNPFTFFVARKLGLRVLGWTIRSLDTRITEPERIVQRIAERLVPGAIILLHDGNIPPERLLPTVKLLLAKLREQNYAVVRLDKLME